MNTYSYHIFYFPFPWLLSLDVGKSFSHQVDLHHIPVSDNFLWERKHINDKNPTIPTTEQNLKNARELFEERQYFFDFVHPVLCDIILFIYLIRMFELVIIQHASMSRLSSEVTKVSAFTGVNNKRVTDRISSL
ncbi:hypothetical protein [Phocaeicola barnesiae]|uniref:hypothetical protein n=1 Tax=Phocaeicola barnesiae TaxID=376804 RepID=UPI0024332CE1|nr:hypothetical protein [Phocaeicola barnesiae]